MSIREIQLGDAITVKHGFAFKSKYFSEVGEKVVLTPGNFYEKGGFKRRINKDRYYLGDFPENYILEKGDLVIAMTEQGAGLLGSSAWIPDNDVYLHNQRLGLVHVINNRLLHKKYLYHLFNSHSVRGQIFGSASGTKVRHTSPDKVYKVKVIIPEISSQEKIAEIIDSYDDLIENNRRRIELLEESARLLYKEWFVQLRFPGHEHIQIINGVPEGWSKVRLVDLAELTMGQSPKSEFYNENGEGLPFHQGVTNYGFRFVDNKTYCSKITRLAEAGDILCSVRAPVGRLNLTLDKMILGRGLSAIRSKSGRQSFLFYALRSFFFKEDIMGNGAIYASVTKKDMENIELHTPPLLLEQQFEEFASDIDVQIMNLSKQNKQLVQARDILLPRLMNGTLTV